MPSLNLPPGIGYKDNIIWWDIRFSVNDFIRMVTRYGDFEISTF